jgi:hypothetical protein
VSRISLDLIQILNFLPLGVGPGVTRTRHDNANGVSARDPADVVVVEGSGDAGLKCASNDQYSAFLF